ncbi:MAG: Na+/H+ antiporter NhaC family protein [bacterium]|nr:Na+/H+ antiporter NhaC family protein [bacterium]
MRPEEYGLWVLLPALAAIVLAVVTRRVLPALAVGILVASYMVWPCLAPEDRYETSNHLTGTVRVAAQSFIWDAALYDADHLLILAFTSVIAAMVGVIGASGGTRALVELIARRATSRRGGQIIAWAAGLIVFFDDYANTMIVGPTMQPIFDRLKVSRAKLAYIVDSTAAPVASIALIGTWLGAEIGFLQEGIDQLEQVPAFLVGVDGWKAFLYSLPHRYYAIFAIVTVVVIAISRRDFGPMRTAELQTLIGNEAGRVDTASTTDDIPGATWWLAGAPVIALIGVTLTVLFYTGWVGVDDGVQRTFVNVLANADAYWSIFLGAIASALLAFGLTFALRTISPSAALGSGLRGIWRVVPALAILALAWALSAASRALHLGETVSEYLQKAEFAAAWLPLGVFLCAALVSFATGTSWGTMAILCPMVVTVAARLAADLPADRALELFYASVGSVLAGAIFGDHCSPISDTTVLSSIASGCSLQSHVWTQLPYALTAAITGVVFGNVLSARCGLHWSIGLLLGAAALIITIRLLGRPTDTDPPAHEPC